VITLSNTTRLDPARCDEEQCRLRKVHGLSSPELLSLLMEGFPNFLRLAGGVNPRAHTAAGQEVMSGQGVGVVCSTPGCWLIMTGTWSFCDRTDVAKGLRGFATSTGIHFPVPDGIVFNVNAAKIWVSDG
jgi:hypothetical protein